MDRFIWFTEGFDVGEEKVYSRNGVRLFDGDSKTSYDNGNVLLTSYRLIWQDLSNSTVRIFLPLATIKSSEWQSGGFARSAKICLDLHSVPPNKKPGPYARSQFHMVKLGFKNGGEKEFLAKLNHALQAKKWQGGNKLRVQPSKPISTQSSRQPEVRPAASGIGGIQRNMEAKARKNEENISLAFQDLSKLMAKAKEMVELSKNVANKIKEKKGAITDDETIKFKSHLLSLGIPNPVTKETHGSGTHYHMQLAHEICKLLRPAVDEGGGIMLLADAYCRINRARGMELLSPDDLLQACRMMENLKVPLKLRQFDSGVLVLQSEIHNDDFVVKQTNQLVEESKSLSAQELANFFDISVLLAKERLLLAEQKGGVCRDDSSEGLRFYPNLFLTKTKPKR